MCLCVSMCVYLGCLLKSKWSLKSKNNCFFLPILSSQWYTWWHLWWLWRWRGKPRYCESSSWWNWNWNLWKGMNVSSFLNGNSSHYFCHLIVLRCLLLLCFYIHLKSKLNLFAANPLCHSPNVWWGTFFFLFLSLI